MKPAPFSNVNKFHAMQYQVKTARIMSKEVVVDFLRRSLNEMVLTMLKSGLWVVILFFIVSARIFYQVVKEGRLRILFLLALAALELSLGIAGILICYAFRLGPKGYFLSIIAALMAFGIIDYFVQLKPKDMRKMIRTEIVDLLEKLINKLK